MVSYKDWADEQLMQQFVLKGENTAFEELVHRYEKALYNFAYPYYRNPSQSEDLVQDVFVRCVEHRASFRFECSFKNWIYRIARNRIYDELRKKKRWLSRWFISKDKDELPRLEGQYPDTGLSPRETLNQKNLEEFLMSTLQKLDDKSRDILILRFIHGLPVRDVSQILNIPEGTIHSHTHRALKNLHKLLIKQGIKPEDWL